MKKTLKHHQDDAGQVEEGEKHRHSEIQKEKSGLEEARVLEEKKRKLERLLNDDKDSQSMASRTSSALSLESGKAKTGQEKIISDIIEAEDRALGRVSKTVYLRYFTFVGGWWFLLFMAIFIVCWVFLSTGSTWWLQYWSVYDEKHPGTKENLNFLYVYAGLSFSVGIVTLIRIAVILFTNLKVSSKLHSIMTATLLHASVTGFFDRVPVGRILNRLSKDLDSVDAFLAFSVSFFTLAFSRLFGDLLVAIYSSSWYLFVFVVIFMVFAFYLQEIYMRTNREVTRLDGITRSPVVQTVSETLNGLTTIRAFNQEKQTLDKYIHDLNENQKNSIVVVGSASWFSIRLSLCSLLITVPCILWGLLFNMDFKGSHKSEDEALAEVGLFALLLNYLFLLNDDISAFLQNVSLLETRLISLERCQAYTK